MDRKQDVRAFSIYKTGIFPFSFRSVLTVFFWEVQASAAVFRW